MEGIGEDSIIVRCSQSAENVTRRRFVEVGGSLKRYAMGSISDRNRL